MLGKRWKIALCLLLLSSTPNVADDRKGSRKAGSLERRVEIPFKLYNDHLIIVKGTLGSLENVNLMLDTGKSPTAISREIAGRLHLQGNSDFLLMSNGKMGVESVVLPGIQIGALRADVLRVVVQDLSYLKQKLGISVAGIAGLDVLGMGSIEIDYDRKKIVFGAMEAGAKTIPFETRRPFLTVKATIDGQEMRLLVDSGTTGLLLYRSRLKRRLERPARDGEPVIATAIGVMHAECARAARVTLGKENFGPQKVIVADVDLNPSYDFDGLMGFREFEFHKVWLDFDGGLFGWE